MDNSDSSEDENLNLLKEAIDTSLITDSIYKGTEKLQDSFEDKPIILRSLRKQNYDDDQQFKELKVSPEFQSHVAKHLEKMLDEWLTKRLQNDTTIETSKRKRSKKHGGVRLLSCSTTFLSGREYSDTEEVILHNRNYAKKFKNVTQFENDIELLNSVAVDSKYILSGAETVNWAKRQSRGKIFVYKKCKDNLLRLIEPYE